MIAYFRYFGYFVYLFILWIYARRNPRRVTVKEQIGEKTVTRYNWIFALVAVAPLIYLTATRGNEIGDTGAYKKILDSAPSALSGIREYINGISKEQLFFAYTSVIKSFFGNNYFIYFSSIALMQLMMMTVVFRKYSENFLISLFIFVASTDFISYMNNGIRQFIAVCVVFSTSKFIFEKRYLPTVLAIVIAFYIHRTALLMLPLIIIVQGEPWNKSTTAVLLAALLTVAFVGSFTSVLEDLLSETSYSNIVSNWQSWNDNGTNPIRVAVYCVPAMLSIFGIRYIREEQDQVINICTNMSVFTAGLYIVSMVTSGVYMGRLPIYTAMYSNCILLPWLINHIFNKKSSALIVRIMIVCYFLFYYYQIHFSWSMI